VSRGGSGGLGAQLGFHLAREVPETGFVVMQGVRCEAEQLPGALLNATNASPQDAAAALVVIRA